MEENKNYKLEIMYKGSKLCDYQYNRNSEVLDIKNYLTNLYQISITDIHLKYNNQHLEEKQILSKLFLPNVTQISGEKIKIRIIPQINFLQVTKNIKFKSYYNPANDEEDFSFVFDVILHNSSEIFKKEVYSLFTTNFAKINYKLDHEHSEFKISPENPNLLFNNDNKEFIKLRSTNNELIFYFMVKNSSIEIYKFAESNKCSTTNEEVHTEIRKITQDMFPVIVQTYDSTYREIDVSLDMTLSEFKDLIEALFGIRKHYQELLYLVYKLSDDNKKLKDYYIRPHGIVFLRGYYFPILFCDFYKKSISKVIGINIAESVAFIKQNLIKKLELDFDEFALISNGKELDNDSSLIDYNIQRMQTIFFK